MRFLILEDVNGDSVEVNLCAICYVTKEQDTNNYQLHFNNQQTIAIHSGVYWNLLESALYPEEQ